MARALTSDWEKLSTAAQGEKGFVPGIATTNISKIYLKVKSLKGLSTFLSISEILVLRLQFRGQNLLYATPKLVAEATVKDIAADTC